MTTQPIKLDNKETVLQFLDSYDTFLFDCDGVLWSDYTKKFANFGIENVTKDQIFSSSFATAIYMKELQLFGPKNRQNLEEWDQQKTPFLPCDPSVKAVVAGLDTKINFHRLCVTFNYLKQDDVKYVATNIDTTFPGKPYLQPGCGSMIELLTKSSGRPEPPNCGKPSQLMLDTVFEAFPNLKREKCCMIGDRLNTDIKFGIDGKLGGQLLVLSGVEKESCLSDKTHGFELPKYYADKLGDVYEHYSK
ncbi:unnamed protein product [Hanseniaspora opuntiae]